MEKRYLETSFSNSFERVNEEFLKCTVAVMSADGQKANGTKFSMDAIEKAIPTLNYCPLIGYFNGEDFTDHGIELVINNEGFNEIVKTVPFGVVIKDSARFVDMPKMNGETEKYLVCDVYMWARYKEATTRVMDNKCNQSMEIFVNGGEWKEDYYDVTDFTFTGLCILGEDVTPAFNLAKIRTSDRFNKDDFKVEYQEMTSALDRFLNFEEEEETVELEKVEETMEQEIVEETIIEEEVTETEEVEETEVEETIIEEEVTETEVEETPTENNESYESDEEDEEKSSDEEEEEEEEEKFTLEQVEEIKSEYQKTIDDLKVELVYIQSAFSDLESECEELRTFKSNYEKEQMEIAQNEVFEKYSELAQVEGYSAIIENKDKYSIEELERELKILAYDNGIIIGKKKNFAKKESTVKIPVGEIKESIATPHYGGLLDKYINR